MDQQLDSAFTKRKESIELKSRRGFHLRDSLPRGNDKMKILAADRIAANLFDERDAVKWATRAGSELPLKFDLSSAFSLP